MKVGLIASHHWPLPSPARTGDSQIILDLSRSLVELGHEVTLFAPAGTKAPEGVWVAEIGPAARGNGVPTAEECERATLRDWSQLLQQQDIIHDCSVNKSAAAACHAMGRPAISTIWGGNWGSGPARNIVAQSHAQAARLAKGLDDYNAPGGPCVTARVVWNGIDTDAYKPTGNPKQDFFLMFGRWHPVRGIVQAIELAKATGINLLLAGEDPERDHPYQAGYAREMCALARGCDNIQVEFLPADPEHHERKVELYSDARALLFLPQFEEPFGLPQIEAMSCGTPVVGTNRGSVREVTGNLGAGLCMEAGELRFAPWYWVSPKSPAAQLREMEQCRAVAVEHFDRLVMARNYVKLYEEVAGGGGW